MNIYDYNNYNLFVIGDIHGEFKRFFNKVKLETSKKEEVIEEEHPLVKSEVRKKGIRLSTFKDSNSRPTYDNSVIIVAGDCGIGFNKEKYYIDLFSKYNDIFSKTNTVILFIRGNHDDPIYFIDEKINLSNIKTIPDYSIVKTKNNVTLCIGGAISVDRIWRKQQEAIINKYKKDYKKKIYWENEQCVYNKELIEEIIRNNIQVDSIISHSSPNFAFPNDKPNMINWFKIDKDLKKDTDEERKILTDIYNDLYNNKLNIKFWCHGHFHMYNVDYKKINGSNIAIISLSDDYNITSPNSTLDFLELKDKSTEIKMSSFKPIYFDTLFTADTSNISVSESQYDRVGEAVEEIDEMEDVDLGLDAVNERAERVQRRFINRDVEETYERLREEAYRRLNDNNNNNNEVEVAPF